MGRKLYRRQLEELFESFFGSGTYMRTDYGGMSRLASNPARYGAREVAFPAWLEADAHFMEDCLGYGLFHYGGALWRVGEIEPLKELTRKKTRARASRSIVSLFPERILMTGSKFYRVRKNLTDAQQGDRTQYDAPPDAHLPLGRLDTADLAIMYASEDLEICMHECRVLIPDECFVATLATTRELRMLDLTEAPLRDGATPFESLDMAMRFLFAAEAHSYDATRAIAHAARRAGYDGIVYPSYFSLLKDRSVPNLAIFGHPIEKGDVTVKCINRARLRAASYEVVMGPIFS